MVVVLGLGFDAVCLELVLKGYRQRGGGLGHGAHRMADLSEIGYAARVDATGIHSEARREQWE